MNIKRKQSGIHVAHNGVNPIRCPIYSSIVVDTNMMLILRFFAVNTAKTYRPILDNIDLMFLANVKNLGCKFNTFCWNEIKK